MHNYTGRLKCLKRLDIKWSLAVYIILISTYLGLVPVVETDCVSNSNCAEKLLVTSSNFAKPLYHTKFIICIHWQTIVESSIYCTIASYLEFVRFS